MCITPIKVKNSGDQPVPCGRCSVCRSRRISGWSFRLLQEEKRSISQQFITLTYDTKNIPISDKGFMALRSRDLQLFFKRLRKDHYHLQRKEYPIRYYAAGEYGGRGSRPHYHIIIFNCDVERIQGAWGLGSIHYGTVNGASIGYCLKYISKQSRIPQHKNDDRPKEFSRMSKGLGSNYLTRDIIHWHKSDVENRMYVNVGDGKKASMPRYYKDKLYDERERKLIADQAARNAADKALQKYIQSDGHPYAKMREVIEREKENIIKPYKDTL